MFLDKEDSLISSKMLTYWVWETNIKWIRYNKKRICVVAFLIRQAINTELILLSLLLFLSTFFLHIHSQQILYAILSFIYGEQICCVATYVLLILHNIICYHILGTVGQDWPCIPMQINRALSSDLSRRSTHIWAPIHLNQLPRL